jgi:PAS domain S-box-containing protein
MMRPYLPVAGAVLLVALLWEAAGQGAHALPTRAGDDAGGTSITAIIPLDSPPTYYQDQHTGHPAGFAVDVMNVIARRSGLQVTYVYGRAWKDIIQQVRQGSAEVIPAMGVSTERSQELAFTDPVDIQRISFFVRADDKQNFHPGSSATVGVIRSSIALEALRGRRGLALLEFESFKEGLFNLLAGKVDAFACPEPTLRQLAREIGVEDRIAVVGGPVAEIRRAMAVRKDNKRLLTALNKAIRGFIGSPEYQEIYLKWYGMQKPFWTPRRIVIVMLATVMVSILSMGLWHYFSTLRHNRALERSIRERVRAEHALKQNESRLEMLLALSTLKAPTETDLTEAALENAVRLTGSAVGYLHFYDEERQSISLNLWSQTTRQQCTARPAQHYPLERAGIWADAIRQRKPVVHNDPSVFRGGAGFPEGHFPVTRHLSVPIFDDGRIVAVVGVGNKEVPYDETDIRQLTLLMNSMWLILRQKRAEAALQTSELFLKNVLESVSDGIVVLDLKLRILSANRAFCDRIGKSIQEVVGRSYADLRHPLIGGQTDGNHACLAQQALGSGLPVRDVRSFPVRDGSACLELIAYPMRDDQGAIVAAIVLFHDITEQRRLEDQLRHTQKIEAVGRLAGGIAHDFNNILTAIIGYGSLLSMRMSADDPLRSTVQKILFSTKRAAELTQRLLTYSRKQNADIVELDLNALVRRQERLLGPIIGEEIQLAEACASGELRIQADPGQIEQVITNLVTNARDAMPRGGRIVVATAERRMDTEFIRTHGFGKPGRYAVLTVEDSGTGMDDHTRQRIFEPFFTTKEVGKGTGLGLSIVYGIVKQHKGFIIADSTPGRGSTFTVFLPLVEEPQSLGELLPDEERDSRLRGNGERILLAEDDDDIRSLIGGGLDEFGYRVLTAADGNEALRTYERGASNIDLLIIDDVIPLTTGQTIYSAVRVRDRTVPVILLRGYYFARLTTSPEGDASTFFVQKPVSLPELLAKVRVALDRAKV